MGSFDFSLGTEFELYWLSMYMENAKSSDYFNVYGGVNDYLDCRSDDYFLKSCLFEEGKLGSNPKVVKYFEILLNGAFRILSFESRYPIEIKYSRHNSLFSAMPVEPEYFSINDLNLAEFVKTEKVAMLAIFSLVDEKVSHILQVASLGINFINLFKILETIKADIEAKDFGFALTDNELTDCKRFDYTANSPAVIGIDARHGLDEKKFKVAKALVPMSLKEAHTFVTSIFMRYLKNKIRSYKNWT